VSVPVIDTFGVATDAHMPFLQQALDAIQVRRRLIEFCPDWLKGLGKIEVCSVRVVRYKPQRRCLIEYELAGQGLPGGSVTILGKARAKGLDRKTFELLQTLWRGDFGPETADGIRVPEPIGIIPPFQMWLQTKVPGVTATELLLKSDGVLLARRIAEAIHKLHQANVPAHRSHSMAGELEILHQRLPLVAQMKPAWTSRLERLLTACDRLGATLPEPQIRGIHRDFYPEQVLVNGADLYLLDFDLFCAGDPALDAGNFLGHVTEQSLRTLNSPQALADREKALAERFVELTGESSRPAVQAYAILTLVRHVYLSTQFADRAPFTEALLELCEQRLVSTGRL